MDAIDAYGQPIPAEGIILEGPHANGQINDSPLNDADLYGQPIEVGDVPLSDMGNPSQMFGPESSPQLQPAPANQQPDFGEPILESPATPDIIPTPVPDAVPDGPVGGIEQTSFTSPVTAAGSPTPVARKPIPTP